MPKMSDALSNRTIQPGTTNTGTDSETSLYAELIKFLPEDHWEVCDHPQELTKIFGTYGIVPDASIENITVIICWLKVPLVLISKADMSYFRSKQRKGIQ